MHHMPYKTGQNDGEIRVMTSKQDAVKGLIFDIERFSTKDGPGIRTVVFFKGCNMHCYWCHNPESMSAFPELKYDDSKCIGCMTCMSACPNHAHIVQDGKHTIDRSLCTRCFACTDVCYSGALQRMGKSMAVEEVMAEVLEDKTLLHELPRRGYAFRR